MNKIKLFLNLLLVPVYFIFVLVLGIASAVGSAWNETADALAETFRMYK